ncbi:MAG: CBS domain-containing protein [Chloroflexota bacterium]
MLVKQLLRSKNPQVWTVTPDTSVYETLQMMADKNVGALVVVEADKVVGIISERDYARKVILQGKSSMHVPVKDIMTDRVFWVTPEYTIEQCMAVMTDRRIRHLPVLDDDKLVGIVSIGDVVKAIISDQEFMIEQLEKYIVGGGQI